VPSFVHGIEYVPDGISPTTKERVIRYTADTNSLSTLMAVYHIRGLAVRNGIFAIDPSVVIEPYTRYFANEQWYYPTIGAFSMVNCCVASNLIIGRYCSIGTRLRRTAEGHPVDRWTTSYISYERGNTVFRDALTGSSFRQVPNPQPDNQPLVLGNDVYIGQDVTYMGKGVTVGDGAVVGTGALLTKDVPPYAIVGGVPARTIRMRFTDGIIERLLSLKWWRYNFMDFEHVSGDTPIEEFLDILEEHVKTHAPYQPPTLTVDTFDKYFERVSP